MKISVEKAMELIDATLQLNNNKQLFPYFFIVGAGISCPEIPLADTIVELCKKEIRKRGSEYFARCEIEMQQFETNPSKNYSGWIELAYPNSIDRSRFFKRIIKEAKISSANLQLAHILYSRRIASTVFTTNFDDKLKQALELIGVTELFVSENAMDNLVVTPQSEDIQVIHVHGTYNFYDCANLEHEIRAVATQTDTLSSYRVLANFLTNQAPIIVGYSGWENDVIMTCLKERLSYPTPLKYIWVCYSQNAYNNLPEWLRTSSKVDFVIPSINSCEDNAEDNPYVQRALEKNRGTLEATSFFSLLISKTNLDIPEIFKNPFSYYSKRINRILPEHEDVLHLRHWAERMKFFGASNSEFEKLVEQMEHADITNNFVVATSVLQHITGKTLPPEDICFVSESLIQRMLQKENVFLVSSDINSFLLSVLDFVEKNYELLTTENIASNVLRSLMDWKWKNEDREIYISFLDRVALVSSKDKATLDAHLVALGQKSTWVQSEDEQKEILTELRTLGQYEINNLEIRYFFCVASYQLAGIEQEENALQLIKDADELTQQDKSVRLHTLAMKTKSKLLSKLSNDEVKKEWLEDVIRKISRNFDKIDNYEKLYIASHIADLEIDFLKQIDGIKEFLTSIYDHSRSIDLSHCEDSLYMATIAITLHEINDDVRDIQFYNDILHYRENTPIDCKKMNYVYMCALATYCSKSISIVPDQLKIEEIKKYIAIYPDDKECVGKIVAIACEHGDIDAYKSCYELKEAMKYCEYQQKHCDAYEKYVSKDFAAAEMLFRELLTCGIPDLEASSRTNLAFMIRRRETTLAKEPFWEVVHSIPDSCIFKHMNIILYCISEGITDDNRLSIALQHMHKLTAQEIKQLVGCWGNPELVGQEEHSIAMSYIEEA